MAARTLNISLPKELRDLVVREVADGAYGSVSEYVREAVRESLQRRAVQRLEALVLEGLASPSREIGAAEWKAIHARARKMDRAARR